MGIKGIYIYIYIYVCVCVCVFVCVRARVCVCVVGFIGWLSQNYAFGKMCTFGFEFKYSFSLSTLNSIDFFLE